MATEKNTEKMKALDAVLMQIEKQYGKGSIMRLGDEAGKTEIEVIPSGCLTLDLALGIGGFPRGRRGRGYDRNPSPRNLPPRIRGNAKKHAGARPFGCNAPRHFGI